MNFDSFAQGQIASKIWLCEQLEPHIPYNSTIDILGGWYNVLGFMLKVRKPEHYGLIRNIDIDSEAINIANKICNAWASNIYNLVGNPNVNNLIESSVIINCSVEHFENNNWFNDVKKGTLVCIQSSDITDPEPPWLITLPNPNLESLLTRFPVSTLLFSGTKALPYRDGHYNRLMMIGIV